MNANAAAEVEGTDLEARDVRALTDYMMLYEQAPGLFTVAGEGGDTYTVDAEYRSPEGGCKHARRVAFHTGARDVPAWADRDAMDPLLADHLNEQNRERADFRSGQRPPACEGVAKVATDGGTDILVTDDDGEILDVPGYTEHVESTEQGGEAYVRCEACGRELLVSLGGRDALTHVEGCPNA